MIDAVRRSGIATVGLVILLGVGYCSHIGVDLGLLSVVIGFGYYALVRLGW